ncbi:hypothetical protein MSPP1_002222 [Malassezia sp. CBS 17886]|nr:hypothetical protein MSPP1_002222 [Malassezia sp. CBS 17886]
MANRMAALKALYESGIPAAPDASVDQTGVSFHASDASLGLDSDGSVDPGSSDDAQPHILLSSTDTSASPVTAGARSEDEDASPSAHVQAHDVAAEPEGPVQNATPRMNTTPNRGARPGGEATPRAAGSARQRQDADADVLGRATGSAGGDASRHGGWDVDEESLSTSLRASQLTRADANLQQMLDDEDADASATREASGRWGMQEMRRRTAAGISIKSTLQKIEQLTAERDDLKIEVDFHRRNMSPDDVGAEVIALRQEKLSYVRRLQQLNELVKRQDLALKSVNREVKGWETKLQDYEELSARLLRAEEHVQSLEGQLARAEPAGDAADASAVQRLEVQLSERERECADWEAHVAELREEVAHWRDALEHGQSAHVAELQADLQDAERELAELRANPGDAHGDAVEQLQQQVDEQHESLCALQDALAAERLVVAEREGEVDRLAGELDAAHQELDAQAATVDRAHALEDEVQRLETALQDAHTYHEGLNTALKEKLASIAVQANGAQRQNSILEADVAQLRTERDSLLDSLDRDQEARASLEALNTRLNEKLVELVRDLKDEESAREHADTTDAQSQRVLATRKDLIDTLERQLVQARDEKKTLEKSIADMQRTLQAQDARQRRAGETHANDQALLEAERDRLYREGRRAANDLSRTTAELAQREDQWHAAEDEVAQLRAQVEELGSALQMETRTRLGVQERLETNQRALDDARDEGARAKSRRDDTDRSRPASARSTTHPDAQSRALLAERNALLMSVYEATNKVLANVDGADSPARRSADAADARLARTNFHLFHERLTARLRRLASLQSGFEQRVRAMEREHSERLSVLRKQQDARWGQVERIERSIRTATEKQAQWRQRVADKEGELFTLQRTNSGLQAQLRQLRDGAGERGAGAADTPTRWSVRLRELESRVKEADERVKQERLGAKERAARDGARIRHLQTLLDHLGTAP